MSHLHEGTECTGSSPYLNNSGYGRPPEIHRTPTIGTGLVVDLRSLGRGLPCPATPHRLVASLITALTGERVTRSATDTQRVSQLRNIVATRGWIDGVTLVGTLSTAKTGEIHEPKGLVSTRDLALACVALACMHPPVVIWDALPCWSEAQRTQVLRVRWLRRSEASAAAREAWESLCAAVGGTQ